MTSATDFAPCAVRVGCSDREVVGGLLRRGAGREGERCAVRAVRRGAGLVGGHEGDLHRGRALRAGVPGVGDRLPVGAVVCRLVTCLVRCRRRSSCRCDAAVAVAAERDLSRPATRRDAMIDVFEMDVSASVCRSPGPDPSVSPSRSSACRRRSCLPSGDQSGRLASSG